MVTFSTASPDEGFRPNCVEKFFFGYKLARTQHEVAEQGKRLGPQLNFSRTGPKALINSVQAKRFRISAAFVAHGRQSKVSEIY
jgi:hypothetical protein